MTAVSLSQCHGQNVSCTNEPLITHRLWLYFAVEFSLQHLFVLAQVNTYVSCRRTGPISLTNWTRRMSKIKCVHNIKFYVRAHCTVKLGPINANESRAYCPCKSMKKDELPSTHVTEKTFIAINNSIQWRHLQSSLSETRSLTNFRYMHKKAVWRYM